MEEHCGEICVPLPTTFKLFCSGGKVGIGADVGLGVCDHG